MLAAGSAARASQGFQEVPLASALAAVAREPNSVALLDVRDEDAQGCARRPPLPGGELPARDQLAAPGVKQREAPAAACDDVISPAPLHVTASWQKGSAQLGPEPHRDLGCVLDALGMGGQALVASQAARGPASGPACGPGGA